MGSLAQHKLPVIDLSLEKSKPGTILACDTVRFALEEYGCFMVLYDKLDLELHNSVFSVAEELHDLPIETKTQKTSDKPFHSYLGQFSNMPLLESLGIEDANSLEGIQRFTNIMWPAGNDHFCESIHSFVKLVMELDHIIKRMVFESYGVERLYDSFIESNTYLFRTVKYRTPQMNEDNVGNRPHTDRSFITILHQNDVDGLQIKSKDGQWIDLELSPTSFVVMAGDPFMAWSNGRVRSCVHQVIMNANTARYTVGLFTFPSGIIDIPKELVSEDYPLKFNSFDHNGFLQFSQTEESRKSDCPIKAYCGV